MQRNVDIKLNEEQQKLLNQINFDLDEIIEKRSGQQNEDLVCSLIKQLVEANAIPRIRIEYFVDLNIISVVETNRGKIILK